MATAEIVEKRAPRGKVRLEMESNGKTLSVQLDRAGFHRLIQTLEQLAETGEPQTFEKSGRGSARPGNGAGKQNTHPQRLVFRINDE